MPTIHHRTCHICEANCGLLITMEGREILSIKGNPDHVLSHGHICPKATAIADLQNDPDRLRRPLKKTDSGWQEIGWEQAFAEIGARFTALQADGAKPALYRGNPSAHDYAIGMQLPALKNALGVRAQYSAATLDQMPHLIVYYHLFGRAGLGNIPDIDRSDYIVIVGGNPIASNGSLWTVPDFRGRTKAMQARGGKLIVIDPRRTETADIADRHHFVRPGTDSAFLIALLKSVLAIDVPIRPELAALLDDSWATLAPLIAAFDLDALAKHCGIPADAITNMAQEMTDGRRAAIYGRMGVSVCEFGTLNHWLIQLINIATGNLDREGGMMIPEPALDIVRLVGKGSIRTTETTRGSMPSAMGELPVVTLAEEMLRDDDQRIRAFFILSGNPVLSAPDGRRMERALEKLDLMVAVDIYLSETSQHADYVLPPCGPLEKDHYPFVFGPFSVRNYGCYSKAILPRDADTKAEWEIVAALTQALQSAKGESLPNIREPREVLDEMLRASPPGLSLADLEAAPNGIDLGPLRPCLADRVGHSDGKIHAAHPDLLAELERFRAKLETATSDDILLIGRRHVRSNNSWLHNSRRLIKGSDRCTLMLNPEDAKQRGIADGDLVLVRSRVGEISVAAELTDSVMPGVASLPHGYGHHRDGTKLSVASERPGVSLNDLTDPALFDALSGNAVLNGVPVTLARALA